MNNILNYELSKLNSTLELLQEVWKEIASSLSSIDDGIAGVADSLENLTERLDQDD